MFVLPQIYVIFEGHLLFIVNANMRRVGAKKDVGGAFVHNGELFVGEN